MSSPFSSVTLGAQLSREELLQTRWVLGGLLMLVALAAAWFLDLVSLPLLAAATGLAVASVARPAWLAKIPRWVHRLAFPVSVTVFTADLWITGELLQATVRLDLLLLSYRAITYRQRRDDLQLIVLGLFLVVLAGVLTVSLLFVGLILLFAALALALLLTLTLLQTSGGEAAAVPERVGEPPAWARTLQWGRLLRRIHAVARWRVLALGSALFLGLVAGAALLFLAIPRFQLDSGLFLERFVSKKTRTGFSDTIRFGAVTEITQDNSVALTVDVSDRAQIPAAPYWRMLVLDEYANGTFQVSPSLRQALGQRMTGTAVRGDGRFGRAAATWTFYLESGVSRYVPLLGRFERLRFWDPQDYRYSSRLGVVALNLEPAKMLAYRVDGMVLEAGLRDRAFAGELRRAPAAFSTTSLRTLRADLAAADAARLAARTQEAAGAEPLPAAEFSQRVTTWLAQRHGYSLQPKIPAGAGDVVVRWLDSTEGGHCELFAGAFALMARGAGYPTRVIAGFRGGSWNAYSNNFTIRNSDAHAWCEIYDAAAEAWVRVDPTPGASAASGADDQANAAFSGRIDRSLMARWESLRVFWYRRVVNFDQSAQRETVQSLKEWTVRLGHGVRERWRDMVERVAQWAAQPWGGERVLAAVAGATGLAGLLWALCRWGRVWRFRGSRRRGEVHPTRRAAAGWLRRLTPWRLPLRQIDPGLTHDLERLRYGPEPSWPEPVAVFVRARRALRRLKRLSAQEAAVNRRGDAS